MKLSHVSIAVDDYDKAIKWYTEKLGLELRNDTPFGNGGRWVTVAAKGQDVEIVLFQTQAGQEGGNTPVGGVFGWVFATEDCRKEIQRLKDEGVKTIGEPEDVPWGVQATFEDLYGNAFVLVEPKIGQK